MTKAAAHLASLGLLGYLAVPALAQDAPRLDPDLTKARTHALYNSKQLALGFLLYEADHNETGPYVKSTEQVLKLIKPYLKGKDYSQTFHPKSVFRFNMALSGVAETDIPLPASTLLFYETLPWADGRRVVSFTDAHARLVDEAKFKALSESLHLKLKKTGKPLKPTE